MDEQIQVTTKTRPSNDIVFGLVFQDPFIFKTTIKCVADEDIDESYYVVNQKENQMQSSIYNKIKFDVYAESNKIYTLDMENGDPSAMIHNRLVYYACRAVGGQKVKKFEYGKLKTCVISFIFEEHSYKRSRFLTRYYISAEIDGKIEKYSDLLSIIELNLGYYTGTDDKNLNILCEFLRIQNNKQLSDFHNNYAENEFGSTLYKKYIEVVLDKDIIEKVGNMDLYQEKFQLKYHNADEAIMIGNKKAEKIAEKLFKFGMPIENIAESTDLPIDKIKEIAKKYNKEL